MRSSTAENRHLVLQIIGFALLLAALFVVVRMLPVVSSIERFEDWSDDLGAFAPLIFAAIYVIAGVLLVPDILLKLAAGAFLGLFWGIVVASPASAAVAASAFLIARYLAQGAVRAQVRRYPKFRAVYRAIGRRGWRIVALLRLVPIFPFNFGNYLLGLTSIRFWPYVLATWVARLPGVVVWVYLGHMGRVTLESAARGEMILEPANLAMLAVGLVAAVAATIYITAIARRAIAPYVREAEAQNGAAK